MTQLDETSEGFTIRLNKATLDAAVLKVRNEQGVRSNKEARKRLSNTDFPSLVLAWLHPAGESAEVPPVEQNTQSNRLIETVLRREWSWIDVYAYIEDVVRSESLKCWVCKRAMSNGDEFVTASASKHSGEYKSPNICKSRCWPIAKEMFGTPS